MRGRECRRRRRWRAILVFAVAGSVLSTGVTTTPSLAAAGSAGDVTGRADRAPRPVGVRSFTFVDRDRRTPADPSAGITPSPRRVLPTTVYYPARGDAPADGAPVPDAPAAPGRRPLVVFSPGSPATPEQYVSLLAEWASRGYVVAALQHPVSSLAGPDTVARRDLPKQSADTRFVLDELFDLDSRRVGIPELDDERVAAAGHSFGGATALSLRSTCCRDDRVVAVIALASVVETEHGPSLRGLAGPVLFVHARADPAVPYAPARRACEKADAPKRLLTVEQVRGDRAHVVPYLGRDDPYSAVVRPAIVDFLDGYVRDRRAARARVDGAGAGSGVVEVSSCRGGAVTSRG